MPTGPQGPPGVPGTGVAFLGQIAPTALATAAAGWLMCDGSACTSTYASLRAALIASGSPYGLSGSDPLLPNLNAGRVPIGKNASHPLGQSGGAESVALAVAEMPSHSHGGATAGSDRSLSHTHSVVGSLVNPRGGGVIPNAANQYFGAGGYTAVDGWYVQDASAWGLSAAAAGTPDHLHAITAQGGGGAHNNMPPFVAVNYVIFAGV